MRLGFTFLLACLFIGFVGAQDGINEQSPFPADFVVLSPSSAAGIFDYGTMSGGAAGDANPEWGPRLNQDVQGELVWAFNATDSLGCFRIADGGSPIETDVEGKVAFIRRGGCTFVDKVLNAQRAGAIGVVIVNHFDDPAQDANSLVNMIAGDTIISDSVEIPAVFVSRTTGMGLQEAIDAGEFTEVLYDVKSFYDAATAWSYRMPLDNYEPYQFAVNYVNPDEDNAVDVTVTAVVRDPSGVEVATFTATQNIAPLSDSTIQMAEEDVYVPTETGIHTVTFTQDLTNETLEASFAVTDFTWGTDAVNFQEDITNIGPSQDQYNEAGGSYQGASLVLTAENAETSVATFASFGLANPQDFFDDFTGGEEFEILVYEGVFANTGASFDNLTVIGGGIYTVQQEDTSGQIFFVELEEPVVLDADEIYYVSVRKTAGLGSGIPPNFVGSVGNSYQAFTTDDGMGAIFATPLALGTFFGGGWNGLAVWTRLHLDGFDPSDFEIPVMTNTRDIQFLDANQVVIAPNPVQEQLNVTLDLNSAVSQAIVRVLDVNGRVLGQYKYEQVTGAPIQIDVNNLKSGTYFLSVATPEGYRMKKFIKQ